jgi:hypothetical protein
VDKNEIEKRAGILRQLLDIEENLNNIKIFKSTLINFKGFELPKYIKDKIIFILDNETHTLELYSKEITKKIKSGE